jgi:hypothetical protein
MYELPREERSMVEIFAFDGEDILEGSAGGSRE